MPDPSVGSLDPCGCCGGSESCELPARIAAAVRDARAATVQEIRHALTSDEAGAAYFDALTGPHRTGPFDHNTMLPVIAAWDAVARRFASPTGTGDNDG